MTKKTVSKKSKKKSKPYSKRSDLEKISSQWRKISGLHNENQSSAAIVRCATAAELACNYVIRKKFKEKSKFDQDFVEGLLVWANGISGKMSRLLLPLCFDGNAKDEKYSALNKKAVEINSIRNRIVHSGAFCKRSTASKTILSAKEFIEKLVNDYDSEFSLKEISTETIVDDSE